MGFLDPIDAPEGIEPLHPARQGKAQHEREQKQDHPSGKRRVPRVVAVVIAEMPEAVEYAPRAYDKARETRRSGANEAPDDAR